MARPTLWTHRKFLHLCSILKNKALAVGSLELIWRVGYESGDAYIGDTATVEYAAGWDGEPGKLTAALATAGFIEADNGGFTIHDLDDHAPEYVHKRRVRENSRRASGKTIRELRSEAGKKGASVTHALASVGQTSAVCQANGVTPAPAPAPAPAQLKDKTNTGESELSKIIGMDGQPVGAPAGHPTEDVHFVAFFNSYPRKVKREAALRAWVRIPMTAELREKIMYSLTAQCSGKEWRKIINSGNLQYIPYPATWLTDKQWEDETQCKRKRTGF